MPVAETPVKREVVSAAFRTLLKSNNRYGVVVDDLPSSLLVSAGKTSIYD